MATKKNHQVKEADKRSAKGILERYAMTFGIIMFVAALSFTALFFVGQSRRDNQRASQKNCPVTACISLFSEGANPETITVPAGSYVQFNSSDGGKHNIMLAHSGAQHDDPQRYESGDFGAQEAWKVQFKKDGGYTFRDKYNDKINVSVIVYSPGKDYKIR